MGTLIYLTNVSLDGYIEDARGTLEWAPPDDDVFAAMTDLVKSVEAFLYGRRLYETMAVWETDPSLAEQSALRAEFATAWRAADKVVYSTTLTAASTAATRIEHHFDPDAVRAVKDEVSGNLTIGGADLAAGAFVAGLVDECQLFVWPVVLGGGKPALPAGVRTDLELLEVQQFANGVVHLRYRVST
jgi:dihydrofolate reductase